MVIETIKVKRLIAAFKSRAAPIASHTRIGFDDYTWAYYPVPRMYDYEKEDNRNVFYDEDKTELGQKGDILLNRHSAFHDIPIVYQFISYNFGGHAALRDSKAGLYETTGMNVTFRSYLGAIFSKGYDNSQYDEATAQHLTYNYWLDKNYESQYQPFYRKELMSMRVKYAKDDLIDKALSYASYQIERNPYIISCFS